jgi:hypothetical protein
MTAASQIKEHMDMIASDGHDCLGWTNIGKVDHLDGADKIKLTKSDAPDGKHHLIPVGWVDHVDQHVHLNKASKDVKAQWSEAA